MIYKKLVNIAIVLYKINNSSLSTTKAIYKNGIIKVNKLSIKTRMVYDENIGVKTPCVTRKEFTQLLEAAKI